MAGDEDIGEIRNIVGFHIRLAHGAVYRHFTETFAHLELTQKQVSALWLVADHPDIAQTGLAQRMRMDRATTMAIVNRLESKGYLVRRPSRSDGRKQALNLTEAGRRTLVDGQARHPAARAMAQVALQGKRSQPADRAADPHSRIARRSRVTGGT